MTADGTTGYGEDEGPDDGNVDEGGEPGDDTSGHADDGMSGDADAGDHGDDGGRVVDDGDADGGGADDGGGGDGGDAGDAGDAGDGGDAGEGGDAGDGAGTGDDGGDPHDDWGPADGDDDGADGWGQAEGGGKPCDSAGVQLMAGQHHVAGWVDVTTDDEGVHIAIDTQSPWTLQLVHVYVGIEAPPQGDGGLIPGQFPYIEPLDSASEYELVVPWDLVDGACGETLQVAIHAEVAKTGGGMTFGKETAWGQGPWSADGSWSSWLDVTSCCY